MCHMKHRKLTLMVLAAVVFCLVVVLSVRERPKLYRVAVLPSLGGKVTTATAINNRGQVVGYGQTEDGVCRLFLWDRENGMEDLGPASSALFHINDVSQIAGTALDSKGNKVAFFWDRARGTRTLGTLGGTESMAQGLNNHGQVVGWSRTATGLTHAFVWDEATGMRDLGTPEGDDGEARAINDSGQIVGVSDEAPGHPAMWTPTGPAIPVSPRRILFGFSDINSHGYTAGSQRFEKEGDFMVLWRQNSSPKKLFPIEHNIASWPLVNDANQLLFAEVHYHWMQRLLRRLGSFTTEYYLWDPNLGRILLNSRALGLEGDMLELFDLNNRGCLVGRVWGPRSPDVRAVLLEPIPERWSK
ncbi:MAG: hypothetical protein A2Y77_11935 [Planctomycetes bacterium RBG_13_62_9]|nr:MAG: hypothetical protein A2Y77_11935 [Planctomycetes bacterium RBG_13_62_9]